MAWSAQRWAHGSDAQASQAGWDDSARWQQQQAQWAQSTAWMCNPCGTRNWTPKTKCSCCGIKKSWAQVAAAATTRPAAQPRPVNPVQVQIDKVSELLKHAPAPPTATPDSPAPPATSTRSSLRTQIKNVEQALHWLPEDPDFDEQRAVLHSKIEELKQGIHETVPIGARIDSARGLVVRAQKRQAAAQQASALAAAAAEAADVEVAKAMSELEDLEAALAKAPPPPVIGEAAHMDAMTSHIDAALAQLSSSPGVDPAHVGHAQEYAQRFIAGMRKTFEHAKAPAAAGASPSRRRAFGKFGSSFTLGSIPPMHAHRGTRPAAKRPAADFFEEERTRPRQRSRSALGFRANLAAEAPF